jgi:uncharacterized repeat protein (TIGR03803 family)
MGVVRAVIERSAWIVGVGLSLLAPASFGTSTFEDLYSFSGKDDQFGPVANVILGSDGNYYGTTTGSPGVYGKGGTVFRLTPGGILTTLHAFQGGADGAYPSSALVQAADGYLYGTVGHGAVNNANPNNCYDNGINGCGAVFRVAADGSSYQILHAFSYGDGGWPVTGLTLGSDGNFYGVTQTGGAYACGIFCGTVFQISADGSFKVLHSFDGTDGAGPVGALVEGRNGVLYGTTQYGGANNCFNSGCGTVFRISTKGAFKSLHSFAANGSEGYFPVAGVILDPFGNLYGTTSGFSTYNYGSVYKLSLSGSLKVLHTFANNGTGDGLYPHASLVRRSNGVLYGTTEGGGKTLDANQCYSGCGTVFKLTTAGKITILHSFDITSGRLPTASLIFGGDGNLVGTTNAGGAFNDGTVFEESP